jgi:hypothetical protein
MITMPGRVGTALEVLASWDAKWAAIVAFVFIVMKPSLALALAYPLLIR